MNIEQKLAFVRRALELGADIDLYFHNIKDKQEAKKTAVELSKEFGLKHRHLSHNDTNWYKLQNGDDYSIEASIYFDGYMVEDVTLDGGEQHESA